MLTKELDLTDAQSTLLDNLSDAQWHTMQKIIRHSGKAFSKNLDAIDAALVDLVDKGMLIPGQNKSFRFSPLYLEDWRTERNLVSSGKKDLAAPRYFGGVLEDEGWLQAPLRNHDLVHFRIGGGLDVREVQRRIGIEGIVRQDTDGLVRISCLNGDEIYEIVKTWDGPAAQEISGVRLDKGVKRRELSDLPPGFVSDLCAFYGTFAHTLLRRNMTSVRKHIPDADDIQQQIYIWIIDAVQRYDETTSIPFAAYLHSSLQRWVHDLNRKSYGRAAADSELAYTRAINAFITKNDRKPTDEELAEVLGESVATVREKMLSISRVNNLRAVAPLAQEDYEIPVQAEDDQERDFHSGIEQTLLAAALTSSALDATEGIEVLGLLKAYDEAWGGGKCVALKKINNEEILTAMKSRIGDVIS